MSDSTDRTEPSAADRRQFLKSAGAVVAVAALHVVAGEAGAATAKARNKPMPTPAKQSPDPYAAARPDTSICRTADERATLERQWKGMVDLVKVVRDAPLDPAVEPVTVFAALPRKA